MGGRLWFWCPDSKSPPGRCDDKVSVFACSFFCCVDSLEHQNPSKSLAIGRSFRFRNSTCPHQQGYWTLSRPSLWCQPSRLSEQFVPHWGTAFLQQKIQQMNPRFAKQICSFLNNSNMLWAWSVHAFIFVVPSMVWYMWYQNWYLNRPHVWTHCNTHSHKITASATAFTAVVSRPASPTKVGKVTERWVERFSTWKYPFP